METCCTRCRSTMGVADLNSFSSTEMFPTYPCPVLCSLPSSEPHFIVASSRKPISEELPNIKSVLLLSRAILFRSVTFVDATQFSLAILYAIEQFTTSLYIAVILRTPFKLIAMPSNPRISLRKFSSNHPSRGVSYFTGRMRPVSDSSNMVSPPFDSRNVSYGGSVVGRIYVPCTSIAFPKIFEILFQDTIQFAMFPANFTP